MAIRCKIVCHRITEEHGYRDVYDTETKQMTAVPMPYRYYEFHAVMPSSGNGKPDPEHENWKFWSATPNLELKVGIYGERALFEVGREYFTDFVKAIADSTPAPA